MVNTALPLPPKRSLTLLLAALYGFCRLILWGICALVGSAARSVANAPLALLPGTLGMPFSFACVVKLGSRRPLRTVSLIAFVRAIFCIVVPVTIIFRGLCGKVSQDNPVPGSRATQSRGRNAVDCQRFWCLRHRDARACRPIIQAYPPDCPFSPRLFCNHQYQPHPPEIPQSLYGVAVLYLSAADARHGLGSAHRVPFAGSGGAVTG